MIDYLNYGKQVQSIPKEPESKIRSCVPNSNHGWLEYKLNQTELDYVWSCVNDQEVDKENWSHKLAGNISNSYLLEDKNDWFYNTTIIPLIDRYESTFTNLAKKVPICSKKDNDYPPYVMNTWWVNYQKQCEFNPPHDHHGVYSFVIWLKIPYDFEEQNKNNVSNAKVKGAFSFTFMDLFGSPESSIYKLNKGFEGIMLLFPSKLNHSVFPFYNCEEERISVSGNLLLDV